MLDHPPHTATELRDVLAVAGLAPRKSLGQNFLVSEPLRNALVADAGVRPGDTVLEIGVGLGVLTEGLLAAGARVIGVELDRGMFTLASQLLASRADGRLTLLNTDALDGKDLSPLVRDQLERAATTPMELAGPTGRLMLVANLPYNVASTILLAALEWSAPTLPTLSAPRVRLAQLAGLVQLEVAERLTAKPGTEPYGGLSVLAQAWAKFSVARKVGASVFVPRPNVDSAFIVAVPFDPAAPAPLGLTAEEYPRFKSIVLAAFQHRRKTLTNALGHGDIDPASARRELVAMGLDEGVRGEVLSAAQFAELARRLGR